jgi:hypothetical protein
MPNRRQYAFTADGDVTKTILKKKDEIIIGTAGISLVVANPDKELSKLEQDVTFTNITAGYGTLRCTDLFLGGIDSVIVPPYESVKLRAVLSGSTYYWRVVGNYMRSDMKTLTWVPTLAFTTATPTLVSESYDAWVVDGICYFIFDIYTDDGAGATALTITPPIRPKDTDVILPIEARCLVDTTYTDAQGYLEMANSTNTSRVISFNALPTWTDDKACHLYGAGFYEVAGGGWEAWTPTTTYTTSNWDSATTAARTKSLDGAAHIVYYSTSADAKGVTAGVQFTPPTFPPDVNSYTALMSIDKCVAGDDSVDYDNNFMYLDCDNATEASRLAATHAVGVMANGKAGTIYVAGVYEQYGWSAFTPTFTFTGTAPATTSKVGRYKVRDGICYFNIYYARTADTAAPTALTISGLPVTPKYGSRKIPVTGHQLVNTTYSNCMPVIYADQEGEADRTLQFQKLSTFTASVAGKLFISGWYPIG